MYNLAKSLGGSFQYANLGLRYSLDRKLPLGKDYYNRKQLQVCFLVQAIISVIICGIYLLMYGFNMVYMIYYVGGAVFAAFSLIRIYYRGIGKTDLFIKSSLWSGILTVIFPIIGLYFWSIYGLVIGYLLATVLVFVIYLDKSIFHNFYYKPSSRYLFSFFKIGFPFLLTNVMLFLADNLDKFIINYYLNIEAVGEYAIITLVYTLSLMIPATVLEIMISEFVKNRQERGLKGIYKKHTLILIGLITSFVLTSYILMPFLVHIFFPKYDYLVGEMRLILFALVPYIIISPIYGVLFALDKRKQILSANVLAIIGYFTLLFYCLSTHHGLLYVVYCKIAYAALYSLFLCYEIYRTGFWKKDWFAKVGSGS